ncbi:uncharacterized protein LOC117342598 [Pecten maximus]|uniref:uncharacterized protein LOC117342598 n=1 Tax=Pecten maximus TaxID=6579 RepID=UPI00145845F2|nr:uncharacterized protein LOC117342598 [Pecten maximus]
MLTVDNEMTLDSVVTVDAPCVSVFDKPKRRMYYNDKGKPGWRKTNAPIYENYDVNPFSQEVSPGWYKMALAMSSNHWSQPSNHEYHEGHHRSIFRQSRPSLVTRPPSNRKECNMNIIISLLAILTIAIVVATPLCFIYIFTEGDSTTTEMKMDDSISTPGEVIYISCNVRYAPSGWDEFSIVSEDNTDIHGRAYPNGAIVQGKSSYIVELQRNSENMTLRIMFPNATTHCAARGRYVCRLKSMGNDVIKDTSTVIITGGASSINITGQTIIKEGDRYEMNCSCRLASDGGEMQLYIRRYNTSDFVMATETPIVTVDEPDDTCYQSVTKTYNFFAEKNQNGTELRCMASNDILSTYQTSSTFGITIDFADFMTTFHLQRLAWVPEYEDKNSKEYIYLASELENDIDHVYKKSELKENYKRSRVVGLEQGSVKAQIAIEIDLLYVITDPNGRVITTKINEVDIVSALVDTLPSVADELQDSELYHMDTQNIAGIIIANSLLPADECTSLTDMVFLLDSSGSIGSPNFEIMKYFIKNFTASVAIGKNALQFGVVSFSTNVRNEFWLKAFQSPRDIVNAVEGITYIGSGTYMERGLIFIRSNAFTASQGARKNAEKVIILMTDGQSSDDPNVVASTLKSEGVAIICVGIGSNIDQAQLNAIAYNTSFVFEVTDFDVLINIKKIVQQSSCDTGTNYNQ